MALARKYRLSKKEFDRVFRDGRTVKGSFFFIRFRNNALGYDRVAIVVPAKIYKKSTMRNRVKRILTEIVRASGLLKKSSDLIFVTLSSIVDRPFEEIKREVEQTINKALAP